MMITQTPPNLMSNDERLDEIALYLSRASQRLVEKKKQAQFDGSMSAYLKQLKRNRMKED